MIVRWMTEFIVNKPTLKFYKSLSDQVRDSIHNFSLKKLLTWTDNSSVERYQLFSKVHFRFINRNDSGKNGGKVVDADFKVRDEK